MRYDGWDVILFPKESHIPIQEFKTACYVSLDEYGRQLPTLTCYISSLPPTTPFRISVHSWATAAKPSALIESRRKASQKVVYTVQVVVDGARVFRGLFEVASKWPQEIAYEKRSLTPFEQPSSQRKPCLEFPPFHQQTLIQSSWDSRDPNGRIQIMLSEQLVSKTASLGEPDLGATHDIVCFSFQHAPKEILEQAGISWPISNPLYLPTAHDRTTQPSQTSPTFSWASKTRNSTPDVRMQSPLSQSSRSTFARPQNPEQLRRPPSQLPPISNFAKPPISIRGNGRASIWEDSFTSFGDSGDDISMDTWSTKRTASNSTGDTAPSEYMYTSSHPSRSGLPWPSSIPRYEQSNSTGWDDQQSRKSKERRQGATLQDDQAGEMVEVISPPQRTRKLSLGVESQRQEHSGRPPTAHTYYPPKMGTAPLANRPSSAAMARTSSYPDFNNALRNASNRHPHEKTPLLYHPSISSDKENCAPIEARLPTSYSQANRVPTPHPFAQGLQMSSSNASLRDPSSVFSSLSHFDQNTAPPPNTAPAHTLSALGNVKSRKEGTSSNSPKLPEQRVRHDQSLLPSVSSESIAPLKPGTKLHPSKRIPSLVEIIDVDAIDPSLEPDAPPPPPHDTNKLSPYKSNHKLGMSRSSMDSTDRLEHQLFSALGDELGSFDHQIDTNGMGPELARALGGSMAHHSDLGGSTAVNPSGSDLEPTVKRKRRGTLDRDGDGDRSPLSKKEKGGLVEGEEVRDEDVIDVVPRLRGD